MTNDQIGGDHVVANAIRIVEEVHVDAGRFEWRRIERLNVVLAGLYGQQFAFQSLEYLDWGIV